jgi:hypothetical protein
MQAVISTIHTSLSEKGKRIYEKRKVYEIAVLCYSLILLLIIKKIGKHKLCSS